MSQALWFLMACSFSAAAAITFVIQRRRHRIEHLEFEVMTLRWAALGMKSREEQYRQLAIAAEMKAAKAEVRARRAELLSEKYTLDPRRFEQGPPIERLDPVLLKRLIQLCHPDKHGNSKTATEVTQQLLAMRRN